MLVQELEEFYLHRDRHFTIRANPSRIVASAQPWKEIQELLVHGAGELSAAEPDGFHGNVGLAYRQNIREGLPNKMEVVADIAQRIARVYADYADSVTKAMDAMEVTALSAEAIHGEVNAAVKCVEIAESNMAIASNMGQPTLIAAAKSALDATMEFYKAARWSWDQHIQQAHEHKDFLRIQSCVLASALADVVRNNRLDAVLMEKPPHDLSSLRVVLSELIEVARTVGKILNHIVPAGHSIPPLRGVDDIIGEVMTKADQDMRRDWLEVFDKLVAQIHRAERQAAQFIVLYREADQMNAQDLDKASVFIEAFFQSVLADDERTEAFVDATMSLEERINKLGMDSLLWDPFLGEELSLGVLVEDIRGMNSEVGQGKSDDQEALKRAKIREDHLDVLSDILTAPDTMAANLGNGVTGKILNLHAFTASASAAELYQGEQRTPQEYSYGVDKRGLPYILKKDDKPALGKDGKSVSEKVSIANGILTREIGEKGFERVYPRIHRTNTTSPYVVYEGFDEKSNRFVQHVAYRNGMVVEYSTSGEKAEAVKDSMRVPNKTLTRETAAYSWRPAMGRALVVDPEAQSSVEIACVPKGEEGIKPAPGFDKFNAASSAVSPYVTGLGSAASTVQKMPTEAVEQLTKHIPDEALPLLKKSTKVMPGVSLAADFGNIAVSYWEATETNSVVPLTKAFGSFGGAFAGAKAGALLGTLVVPGGGTLAGGTAGAVVGALGGTEFGQMIGKEIDREQQCH